MVNKIRIDQYLVQENYFPSRERAKRAIMAGIVYIGTKRVEKSGEVYKLEDLKDIKIKGSDLKYVSRGGLKLEKAHEYWNLDFTNKQMLDVGSSTGGFTDFALQNGIKHVVALDVGTNQLAYKLRIDDKVTVMENTNFRTLPAETFKEKFEIITMDVSFISIKLLLKNVEYNLAKNGIFICLIKPQFELDKSVKRNKKGVITETKYYYPMLQEMLKSFQEVNLCIEDIIYSPIKGGNGNIEFLAKVTKSGSQITKEEIKNLLINQG